MGRCDDVSPSSVEKMLNAAGGQLYEARYRARNRIMPAIGPAVLIPGQL